ncbi:MAG: hypothetical protein J5U17_01780 [Candidatus Methanoperedens sp.]|nr:hypothetical protein [Candidatus Methanoperedens sp.]MCE8426966.1 hypothetical protein [Candidatus Methanoperedens sp.]
MATLKVTKGINTTVLEYDGTSDEVKEMMISILDLQPKSIVPIKVEQIKSIESSPIIPVDRAKVQLPTKDEVITYLSTKPDFEHNYADLQQKFLGKRLSSRGTDKKLYLAFDGIVRRAKDQIAKEHNSEWKVTGHIDLGFKTHISIFKLVKSEGAQPSIQTPQNLEEQTHPN